MNTTCSTAIVEVTCISRPIDMFNNQFYQGFATNVWSHMCFRQKHMSNISVRNRSLLCVNKSSVLVGLVSCRNALVWRITSKNTRRFKWIASDSCISPRNKCLAISFSEAARDEWFKSHVFPFEMHVWTFYRDCSYNVQVFHVHIITPTSFPYFICIQHKLLWTPTICHPKKHIDGINGNWIVLEVNIQTSRVRKYK